MRNGVRAVVFSLKIRIIAGGWPLKAFSTRTE